VITTDKVLRLTEAGRVEDIGPVLKDRQRIYISVAVKTVQGQPPEYYMDSDDRSLIREKAGESE
jgi:hypothetical protein